MSRPPSNNTRLAFGAGAGDSDPTGQQPQPPQRRQRRTSSKQGRSKSMASGMNVQQQQKVQQYYYGSTATATRSRSSSKEFNPMGEIGSVIRGNSSSNKSRGSGPPTGRSRHQRNLSDSTPPMTFDMPPLPEFGRGVVMPNPGFMPNSGYIPNRTRADSIESHGSDFSHHSNAPPPMQGVYMGDGEMGGETQAFLNQPMAGNRNPQIKGRSGGRLQSHMRQQSVNNFMMKSRGQKQPKACRGMFYGILFILQLVAMLFVGLKFGQEALVPTDADLGPGVGVSDGEVLEAVEDVQIILAYQNIVKMAYTCGAFAIIVSALALAFMMAMSRRLVYVSLVFSIGVSFAWGTIGIGISPKSFVPITGIISLMLTVGYMFVVWDRIPFASANLATALTGVRDNLGLVGMAFFFQFLALLCIIHYSITFVGLHDAMQNGEIFNLSENSMLAFDLLLGVSFYWTYQVLRHIVMVTVAGTIGSWWFGNPSALYETFIDATVYNFGSICYGSLFVGFVQFLRQITEGLRPNHENSSLMCLYQCSLFFQERIVNCVDDLADSFTPWAFTYIGLYNYGLKDAGHHSNELFRKRGWTRIVTDDLISTVLTMVSLVIGGLTGSFGVILQALDGHGLTSFGHPIFTSFSIGFLVGIVLSTVLISIIESSVCAVLICFAGSPVEFHRHHPLLSIEMRQAWKEVWPGSLNADSAGALAQLVA